MLRRFRVCSRSVDHNIGLELTNGAAEIRGCSVELAQFHFLPGRVRKIWFPLDRLTQITLCPSSTRRGVR